MNPCSRDVERAFEATFLERHRTRLVGGAPEPLYLPSTSAQPAEIRYRADFVSSALHEVAHWCIAGAARRRRVDYGYWYAEEGRNSRAQAAFERVEVRPQALECLFSEALDQPFRVSIDNPGCELDPAPFMAAVAAQCRCYERHGLPPRAERFRAALLALRPAGTFAA
ncbi:MAG: elongation factor P hydroxylase [Pseudomonadota bacterium]|nr:elongation factor P hydroxylase [Pseudomonadota bacterium]